MRTSNKFLPKFAKWNLFLLIISFMLLNSKVFSADVLINEIFYDPAKTGIGCFVELIGSPSLKLDGYRTLGINGNDGKQYNVINLSGYKINPNGYFVIAEDKSIPNADMMDTKADYQNGPDNIELWLNDVKVDSVGYGDFSNATFTGEKKPTLDLSGYSIGRRKDGFDTDDNSIDFVGLATMSPGESNWSVTAVSQNCKMTLKWGYIKKNWN